MNQVPHMSAQPIRVIVELRTTLEILDKLNTSGKRLFIREEEVLNKTIHLLKSQEYFDLSLYDKTEALVSMLGFNEILDDVSIEVVKSKLYVVLHEMYKSLFVLKLMRDCSSISYINRLNKYDVLFRAVLS